MQHSSMEQRGFAVMYNFRRIGHVLLVNGIKRKLPRSRASDFKNERTSLSVRFSILGVTKYTLHQIMEKKHICIKSK